MVINHEDAALAGTPKLEVLSLERMGIGELQAYIAKLTAEIARAEAMIAQKRAHLHAADEVFRRG